MRDRVSHGCHSRGFVVAPDDRQVDAIAVDPVGTAESDTETVYCQSDCDPNEVEVVEVTPPEEISSVVPRPGHVSVGMTSLDEVQLDTIF